jgi:hypothetical protein
MPKRVEACRGDCQATICDGLGSGYTQAIVRGRRDQKNRQVDRPTGTLPQASAPLSHAVAVDFYPAQFSKYTELPKRY